MSICQINESRATYGFAPVKKKDQQWVAEEEACDKIAEIWCSNGSGIEEWKLSFADMVELFDCDIEYRRGRIDLCGVVDTWEEDCGLNRADFVRLNGKIQSWIIAHSRWCGRK